MQQAAFYIAYLRERGCDVRGYEVGAAAEGGKRDGVLGVGRCHGGGSAVEEG